MRAPKKDIITLQDIENVALVQNPEAKVLGYEVFNWYSEYPDKLVASPSTPLKQTETSSGCYRIDLTRGKPLTGTKTCKDIKVNVKGSVVDTQLLSCIEPDDLTVSLILKRFPMLHDHVTWLVTKTIGKHLIQTQALSHDLIETLQKPSMGLLHEGINLYHDYAFRDYYAPDGYVLNFETKTRAQIEEEKSAAPSSNSPSDAPSSNSPSKAPSSNGPAAALPSNSPSEAPSSNGPAAAPSSNSPSAPSPAHLSPSLLEQIKQWMEANRTMVYAIMGIVAVVLLVIVSVFFS